MPMLCPGVSEGMCLMLTWVPLATEMESRVIEQLVSERVEGTGTWEVSWSRGRRRCCCSLFGQWSEEAGHS